MDSYDWIFLGLLLTAAVAVVIAIMACPKGLL